MFRQQSQIYQYSISIMTTYSSTPPNKPVQIFSLQIKIILNQKGERMLSSYQHTSSLFIINALLIHFYKERH